MTTPSPDIADATRHGSLDALRGIAVMGILLMNIVAFAMPQPAYVNPLAWGEAGTIDLALWAVNMVLVDGKMRGLFSLLFGASMVLVIDRAEARGGSGGSVHARRMIWLAVLGLAHAWLIWDGDILFHYAVIGLIAYAFTHHEPRTLIRIGIGSLAVQFIFSTMFALSFVYVEYVGSQPDASADAIGNLRATLETLGQPGGTAIQAELATYLGSYADIVAFRIAPPQLFDPLILLFFNGFETLGLMLIGMALLRNGFLTGAWAGEQYRRVAWIAYAIGLPPTILLCIRCFAVDFDPIATFNAVMAWASPFRPVLVIGHIALALVLIRNGGALVGRIAAAGRVAFTNYLGTSIAMTSIFYGYGLGLFGEVPRAALYLYVLAGWAVMLLWSKAWLDRFAYGPLEWLWRSLARGALQPMRKSG